MIIYIIILWKDVYFSDIFQILNEFLLKLQKNEINHIKGWEENTTNLYNFY